jgi:hypothetical protein
MTRMASRRKFIQAATLAAVSVTTVTGLSNGDRPPSRDNNATNAEDGKQTSTLFPWIGI